MYYMRVCGACMYICMYVNRVFVFVHVYVCMYVCMHVCMFTASRTRHVLGFGKVCMCVCIICMYAVVFPWPNAFVCDSLSVFVMIAMYICIYVCMYVCMYVYVFWFPSCV
jgi:hypothetical protein